MLKVEAKIYNTWTTLASTCKFKHWTLASILALALRTLWQITYYIEKKNDYHLNVISRKIDETNKANRFANKANRFAPSLLLFRCCDAMAWMQNE